MQRLKSLEKSEAQPAARKLLEGIEKKNGGIPNLLATLANSPAAIDAYVGFSSALGKGRFSPKFREQIALTVSEANGCEYCLAAHSALGRLAGLSDEEIADSRRGQATQSRTEAALRFAQRVVAERGHVSHQDVASLRKAGFDDSDIAEIVANVVLSLYTNYFNHIAGTDVDFPAAQPLVTETTTTR